jgi:TPR repeat protein
MYDKIGAILICLVLLESCSGQTDEQAGFQVFSVNDQGQALTDKAVTLAKNKEFSRAAELFQQAAKQENRQAQYLLGLLYARGDGVSQDYAQAQAWLLKASMGGHPKAMYHLGEMYARGDGIEENPVDALTWFWLATTVGDRYAEKRLRALAPRLSPDQMAEADHNSRALWKKIPHDLKIKRFSLH